MGKSMQEMLLNIITPSPILLGSILIVIGFCIAMGWAKLPWMPGAEVTLVSQKLEFTPSGMTHSDPEMKTWNLRMEIQVDIMNDGPVDLDIKGYEFKALDNSFNEIKFFDEAGKSGWETYMKRFNPDKIPKHKNESRTYNIGAHVFEKSPSVSEVEFKLFFYNHRTWSKKIKFEVKK